MPNDVTEEFHIRDGRRVMTFAGTKLGTSSSFRPTSPRWTELALYRVADPHKYVLEKVGRSKVLHMPGCHAIQGKLNRFVEENPDVEINEDEWELHACVGDLYDLDLILVEETRYWAVIADTAKDVVEHLQKHEDGITFMPRMGVNLLEEAAHVDAEVADAFLIGRVV